eukprot:scaffold2186_cov245-Pinguiococcus_pyrenoidosus.AAC.1
MADSIISNWGRQKPAFFLLGRPVAQVRPGSPLRRTIRTNPGRLSAHSAPYAQLTGAVGEKRRAQRPPWCSPRTAWRETARKRERKPKTQRERAFRKKRGNLS